MQLLYAPASPFARKVLVVLHETGLIDEVELVRSQTDALTTGQSPVRQNPLGKIPTLLRDDGSALYDSRVICAFLNDHAGGTLYPGATRWETLTLEATGDGIMDAAVSMMYELRFRPEPIRFADWMEGQWTKADRALSALEAQWMGHMAGPVDIGQIAVASALGYIDFRFDARNWRASHPVLAEWFAGFSQRPSMLATIPAA